MYVTLLDRTPIFEPYMAKFEQRMDIKKYMCHDGIGVCALYWEGLCNCLKRKKVHLKCYNSCGGYTHLEMLLSKHSSVSQGKRLSVFTCA